MSKNLFKNLNYDKFLSATVITRFGDALDSIALSWMVYVLTGSKLLMGTLYAVSYIPNLVVLPFAGVLADVMSKKKLTVISDFARGISVSIMALFYHFNILQAWHLFVFVLINSFFESIADPSRNAMLPSIIEEEHYVAGSSYLSSGNTFGQLIGISIVGLIIRFAGVWGAILIDGVTFFLSGLLILSIRYQDKRGNQAAKTSLKDFFIMIKQGMSYVFKNKLLISIVMLGAFMNFSFVPFNVLQPVYVSEVLKMGPEGMSYLGAAVLTGIFSGGIVVGRFGNNRNPVKSISLGLVMMGINYALLGLPGMITLNSKFLVLYASFAAFFFGFFLPVAQSPLRAMLMKNSSPQLIGRISSILGLITLSATPIGGAITGIVGESISVSALFLLMGALGIIISLLFGIRNRNKNFEMAADL